MDRLVKVYNTSQEYCYCAALTKPANILASIATFVVSDRFEPASRYLKPASMMPRMAAARGAMDGMAARLPSTASMMRLSFTVRPI